jgi:ankyrin repeat protein
VKCVRCKIEFATDLSYVRFEIRVTMELTKLIGSEPEFIEESYFEAFRRFSPDGVVTDFDDAMMVRLLTMDTDELYQRCCKNLAMRALKTKMFKLFTRESIMLCDDNIVALCNMCDYDERLIKSLCESHDLMTVLCRESVLLDVSILRNISKYDQFALIKACEITKDEDDEGGIITHNAIELIKNELVPFDIVDSDGNTALMHACKNRYMEDVTIKLIESGKANIGQINANGNTALLIACAYKLEKTALKLLESSDSRPNHIGSEGRTALSEACQRAQTNVALKLIDYADNPGLVTNGFTPLCYATANKMDAVASKLIATGKSNPSHVDANKNTALINLCSSRDYHREERAAVALQLIETGESNPGHANSLTALMCACMNGKTTVALAIIATRQANLTYENTNRTALYVACYFRLTPVALAIIATGEFDPNLVDGEGYTLFKAACHLYDEQIITALMTSGKTIEMDELKSLRNRDQVLSFARVSGMQSLVDALTD